jgi:hypothetical protein
VDPVCPATKRDDFCTPHDPCIQGASLGEPRML